LAVGYSLENCRGLYIGKYHPPGGGGNICRCHLGEKYEKAKRKRGKMLKKKEERGKKMRKREL
jgi:hypothetical protein